MTDKKLYKIIFITTAFFCLLFGTVSLYSRIFVEGKVKKIISEIEKDVTQINSEETNISNDKITKLNGKYVEAYLLVRKSQIFAGYKNFDGKSFAVKNVLQQFDQLVYSKVNFPLNSYHYINYLLERRQKGSGLGLYTAAVFLLMSIVSGFFFYREQD